MKAIVIEKYGSPDVLEYREVDKLTLQPDQVLVKVKASSVNPLGGGAYAEYVAVSTSSIGLKPNNMTFEQAAAVPIAGVTAFQSLLDLGQLRGGQKVLVNGASGGVGTFAVQIAKSNAGRSYRGL